MNAPFLFSSSHHSPNSASAAGRQNPGSPWLWIRARMVSTYAVGVVTPRLAANSDVEMLRLAEAATFRSLEAELGCTSTRPAEPAPDTIPEESRPPRG